MGSSDMITISSRIQLPSHVIETVVKNTKKLAGPDKKGFFRVDPAETLNELMRTGEVDKENYSEVLQDLVSKRVIDEKSRKRLKKLLERSL